MTDVVDSTTMWERAPGLMDVALARHDHLIEVAVASHGGIVLKHKGEGDSTFCVFETASAAVTAAVDAQRHLAEESWDEATPIFVRMGIHSGESFQRDRDYYGQTVNRAARLRAVAVGGQVLLSGAAALLVGSALPDGTELRFLRREVLRGIDRLEAIHELVDHHRASPHRTPAPAGPTAQAPLPAAIVASVQRVVVGRSDLVARIEEARRRASEGETQTVLLGGEPGAGKSTLAAVAAHAAHRQGWTVLFGSCDEHVNTPYEPFRDVVGQYVEVAPMAVLAEHIADHGGEIGRLTSKLTARVGALAPVETVDPETTRQLLVEAVTDLVQRAARDRPLLMVLDDIQWADRNTMLLLRRLVRSNTTVPLMTIGTYRSANTERGEFGEMLIQLCNLPTVTDLTVGGLNETELLALLEGSAGHALDHDGQAVAGYLLEETGGNAFFVAELLRHFVETGVLRADSGGTWRVEIDLTTVAVPHTVRAVLQQRLARLGDEAVRVLGVASVAGREFDSDLVAAVLGRDEMSVLDAVEAAVDAALVREVDVGHFEFAHALVQHTLYDGLGATRRGLHHRQLAVAIETAHGDDAPAGVVANHWASTGRDDHAKVAEWARRAGAAAIAALSPEDAVRWFRRALDAVGADDHQRLDLLIALGNAQRWADTDAFRQTLLDAAALAERLGDDRALVRAALANNRGGASRAGTVDEQRVEVLERALAAAGPEDSSERACLLATLAIELSQGGEWERRIALAEEAVGCARRLGDDLTLLRVLLLTSEATRLPTTLDQRLIDTEQLFSIAKRLGDPVLLGIAAVREVRVNIEAAAFDQVDEAMSVLDEVAHLDPYVRMNRLSLKAVLAQIAGDLPGALALTEEARVVGEAEPDALAVYVATAAQILWDMGALGKLLPMIEQSVRDHPGVTGFRAILGIAYCDVDRLDEAAEILRHEAETGFAEHPLNPLWLITMSVVASLCIELGDREAAARLYEILKPWRGRANSSVVSINGLVSESLAGLALVAGDLDRVERDVADALEHANRVGARVSVVRTRLVRARMLAARGRPGDREEALAEVRAVGAEAAAMGMATVQRRAASLAESIDARRGSDA